MLFLLEYLSFELDLIVMVNFVELNYNRMFFFFGFEYYLISELNSNAVITLTIVTDLCMNKYIIYCTCI